MSNEIQIALELPDNLEQYLKYVKQQEKQEEEERILIIDLY